MTRTGSENIIWFADEAATNHALVGGKGANLGNMTGKGFQVPPGFTVSTAAYRAHVSESNIRAGVESIRPV